jgi:hypothetical protein
MRLLLDANLSPRVVDLLIAAGYDALHVGDEGLLTALDTEILERAAAEASSWSPPTATFLRCSRSATRRARRSCTSEASQSSHQTPTPPC